MPVIDKQERETLMKNLAVCLTLMMAVLSVSADAMVMNKLTLNSWGGTPSIATVADPNDEAVVGEVLLSQRGLSIPVYVLPRRLRFRPASRA